MSTPTTSNPYNFLLPLPTASPSSPSWPLRTPRLTLIPFDSDLHHHAHLYATSTSASEAALANFKYLPYGPFADAAAFLEWYAPVIQGAEGVVWFAIFVRDSGEGEDGEYTEYAGNIAYLNADRGNASVEIGHVSSRVS